MSKQEDFDPETLISTGEKNSTQKQGNVPLSKSYIQEQDEVMEVGLGSVSQKLQERKQDKKSELVDNNTDCTNC